MKEKKTRKLKVYGQSGYKYCDTPTIILKGKWLQDAGFGIGDGVIIELDKEKIIVTKQY